MRIDLGASPTAAPRIRRGNNLYYTPFFWSGSQPNGRAHSVRRAVPGICRIPWGKFPRKLPPGGTRSPFLTNSSLTLFLCSDYSCFKLWSLFLNVALAIQSSFEACFQCCWTIDSLVGGRASCCRGTCGRSAAAGCSGGQRCASRSLQDARLLRDQ